MMRFLICMVLATLGSTLGFQIAPRAPLAAATSARLSTQSVFLARPVAPSASAAAAGQRRTWVGMQFGGGDGGKDGGPLIEKGQMPSYEEEQEKAFFNSDLDNAPPAEKVKDPVVLITLAWIGGIFLLVVGLILNGVN